MNRFFLAVVLFYFLYIKISVCILNSPAVYLSKIVSCRSLGLDYDGFFFSTMMASFSIQVLPSIREKHDEFMLRELVRRWGNHKVMVRWLSRFFHYLDRYFIARRSLPALNEVGLTCFRDLVCHDWTLMWCCILFCVVYISLIFIAFW